MRIGLDVSPLHRPHPHGVVRAVRGLAAALEKSARHEIVRLVPPPGVSLVRWRQWTLPGVARREKLDGIHSSVSAFPLLGRGARVQTIHELPWLSGADENAGPVHRTWAAIGPLVAGRIVAPSEHTARGIRATAPLAAGRVRVCPWGVDAIFEPASASASESARADAVLLESMGIGDAPFVLCPGAVRKKKNLAAALRGLARFGDERVRLVVTGERTRDLVDDLVLAGELGLGHRVLAAGDVETERLVALMRRASAVIVLSHSEGFAFPVVEAQACRTPVIVPMNGAQAEVAGDAGLRVDAGDADSVAAAIERAVRDRGPLRAAGSANAARFTWSRCATLVESVWEELA